MATMPWTTEQVIQAMRNKNHVVFEGPDYDLNIIGIRTSDPTVNRFNDFMCVAWRDGDSWESRAYNITTDPGLYWLEKPMNVNGAAVLKAGQYRGAYRIGQHKGYKALQQNKALPVYRDSNRDNVLDFDEATVDEGMFGINIHKAGSRAQGSTQVDKWSAGCQVFSKESEFNEFMDLCDRSAQYHGDVFSYTLLNETDIA